MSGKKGISVGSLLMSLLTIAVTCSLAYVLPKYIGNSELRINTGSILSGIDLSGLTEITVSDMPSEQPEAAAAVKPVQTAAPAPTQAVSQLVEVQERQISITIAGSLMLEGDVRKSAYYKDTKDYDFTEIVQLLRGSLQSDINAVVLHNMFSDNGKMTDIFTSVNAAKMVSAAGFDMVMLGFSDAMDRGLSGLKYMTDALAAQSVSVAGASASQTTCANAAIVEHGGIKTAVLHYTAAISATGKKKIKSDNCAWALPVLSQDQVIDDIRTVRNQGAEIVIVSVDWGKDSGSKPSATQTKAAQYIADAGADVVVGTGSGIVKPAVWLQGSRGQVLCCYNLGCLISDSRNTSNIGGVMMRLQLRVSEQGTVSFAGTECIPTYVWRYKQDSAYQYRIVPVLNGAPDGMDNDQKKTMTKAYNMVRNTLGSEVFALPDLQ